MARKASSKPDSVSPSTATIGFETGSDRLTVQISDFVILPFRVQHVIHHLAQQGMAGFVLASGPAIAGLSNQSGEDVIRRARIEADLVSCLVALPGPLFYSTQIQCRKTNAECDEKLPPKVWQSSNDISKSA